MKKRAVNLRIVTALFRFTLPRCRTSVVLNTNEENVTKQQKARKARRNAGFRIGGGGWIRTTEAKRNRFTVFPSYCYFSSYTA